MASVQSLASRQERETLRRLIDFECRRRIRWDADERCTLCGVEIVDRSTGHFLYAHGCPTCADRRSKHRARATSPRRAPT